MTEIDPPVDPSCPDSWNRYYAEGTMPWDRGEPAPPLARLVRSGNLPTGRTLVVGCGRGHEAALLARAGHECTAIDFAPLAIEAARRTYGDAEIDWQVADLFEFPEQEQRFSLCVEHTTFCAIDPTRRDEYVDVMDGLLEPGGFLAALFYAHGRPGGPPFTTTEEEVRRRFDRKFDFQWIEVPGDSFPSRRGKELLALLRRRA